MGEKLDTASIGAPFAFEVDGRDRDRRWGWSVLLRGIAEEVWREDEVDDLESLHLDSWVSDVTADLRWLRIRPSEITGRRIRR